MERRLRNTQRGRVRGRAYRTSRPRGREGKIKNKNIPRRDLAAQGYRPNQREPFKNKLTNKDQRELSDGKTKLDKAEMRNKNIVAADRKATDGPATVKRLDKCGQNQQTNFGERMGPPVSKEFARRGGTPQN